MDGEEPLNGRTILVIAEQGFGDAIQFARYLPLLARRGAQVVVECAGSLTGLLGAQPGVAAACARGRRPAYDVWVDQMSLPRLFGTKLGNIPYPAGYLAPDAARAARWQAVLANGLRVGLAWARQPAALQRPPSLDTGRHAVAIIAAGRNPLVSLQTGPRAGDMARLYGVSDYSARLTEVGGDGGRRQRAGSGDHGGHGGGASGRCAGHSGVGDAAPRADWRWMLDRPDTPWYRSMRLFRQERRATGRAWRSASPPSCRP